MAIKRFLFCFSLFFIFLGGSFAQTTLDLFKSYRVNEKELIVETFKGFKVRVRPYSNAMVRVQYLLPGEDFFADDHYDIILNHEVVGQMKLKETKDALIVETKGEKGLVLKIYKSPVRVSFCDREMNELLSQARGVVWDGTTIKDEFKPDGDQHLIGFGQAPLGYQDYIDLKDKRVSRNYGENGIPGRGAQGNLLVPFFMSSKGFGLYMNSTFPNDFSFGHDGEFFIGFDTKGAHGQMDYVFIKGDGFDDILEKYVGLTGRPRLIPMSMLGLHLSDNDPRIDNKPICHKWWEEMISAHHEAGFPLDHAVFDNDWRPGVTPDKDGQWGGSKFEFNDARYPDPAGFKNYLHNQGVTLTLDLNLNNCNDSWGWKDEYNMPVAPCGDSNSDSYPDYTRPEVRNWVWELFWHKAVDPALGYPCDGLWIDESDGVWSGCVPDSTILGNGLTWGEMRNYYYFLMGKAIVEEGWSNINRKNSIGDSQRPYVWIRGGTAGGQRFGTHWTGDIHFTQQAYESQIRSLQVSGLSAYPYFNHDAGGFVDKVDGPNDHYYIQWAMAFGSFTPIWRPHGYGLPRWPLNRSKACQDAARKYGTLRYEMMPYIYNMAHLANQTGRPMARPMSFDYPLEDEAWKSELQYMWGDDMLVAPGLNLAGKDSIQSIWLPGGTWYYLWNDKGYEGGQVIDFNVKFGEIPVFVKAGAIIPKRNFAVSTAKLSDDHLMLEVYNGADGHLTLFEDDGVSERYLTREEMRVTNVDYTKKGRLVIHPAQGSYRGAPLQRDYAIHIHHAGAVKLVKINGEKYKVLAAPVSDSSDEYACIEDGVLRIRLKKYDVSKPVVINLFN